MQLSRSLHEDIHAMALTGEKEFCALTTIKEYNRKRSVEGGVGNGRVHQSLQEKET